MGFVRQTWTLTGKNLLLVLVRRWFSTPLRAFIFPIVFMFFISYAKNFFIPPSRFGIGSPSVLRSLPEALNAASGGRDRVAFVTHGYEDGLIGQAVQQLSEQVRTTQKQVYLVNNTFDLNTVCRSSLRGVSQCFGAIDFHTAPGQGGENWNYTLMSDGALGERIFVDEDTNDAEIFVLPLQHAVDAVIANLSGYTPLPSTVMQYPFTSESQEERARNIVRLYQNTLMTIIAVAFFIGICGITYQLVGHMAMERELGLSQLTEAMMPNKRRWQPQAARLLAEHIAFDIIYLPGWIIMGVIVATLVFPDTNVGLVVGLHILIGFALCSYSIFFGSFFKRAQLSGITCVIVSLVLAIIAQLAVGRFGSSSGVIVLSLLFPPMTYVFFLIYMAGFQRIEHPTNLSQYSPRSEWQVSGATFFGLMIVQIIAFPILAAFVERALYGTGSRARKITHHAEPPAIAVKLQNFSKTYSRHWFLKSFLCCGLKRKYNKTVQAVKDLTLDIRRGQIMILLGANGSGKSTTLNAISGLDSLTGGSIEIDGTGGLGLCPQKNVMWDLLTVEEHVRIFNSLKSTGSVDTRQDTRNLIAACDLDRKLAARAGTLSGGQKRKLQLAMMFTGGSRVCCIDEVSSGIDPLARRKVWDILLAERGRRTILLTTHFLDEADVLSDYIALLSKGELKAQGSAVELKHALGSGYRISVDNRVQYQPQGDFDRLPRVYDYDQVIYSMQDAAEASRFVGELESKGIAEYRVQGPTIEDVFLKLAADNHDDNVELPEAASTHSGSDSPSEQKDNRPRLDLLTGQGTGLLRQSWILFCKRFTVLRRNYLPYVAALLVPLIAAGMTTLFLKNFKPLGCSPDAITNQGDIGSYLSYVTADVPLGPVGRVPTAQELSLLAPNLFNSTSLHYLNTTGAFQSYVVNNYHNVTPGGFFLGDSPLFTYTAEYTVVSGVIIQNFVNNLLSNSFANGVNGIVTTQFQSFALPLAQGTGNSLQLVLYTGLALSIAPGFFALYPTAERLRKVRALHYSNGIRSAPIWTAYTAFDFIWGLLISLIIVVIWAAVWPYWYNIGYVFVVLFLYFLTSSVMSYIFSLFVPSQLAAFATAAGYQCVLFLLYFISYMAIITYAPVNKIDDYVLIAHFTIGLITPSGNMLRALLLTLNQFSLLCRNNEVPSYPGGITVFGGPILYLLCQFFVCFAFLIWWDSGGRPSMSLFRRRRHAKAVDGDVEETGASDGNHAAAEELARLASGNGGLRVLHMSKTFGDVRAVEDVTFGISPGEVFALLGPNGAGKSTTISLIRGDLRPTGKDGDVFVEKASLAHHRNKARNHLGVCPQFDAIDVMTVAEHLRFYARARGVPGDVNHNVRTVMGAVGLGPYADRLAGNLSGGNKRKLSLAISLMGNPSVLLLDEPSSGMDALSKRVMWRTLDSVRADRALLITTHSMEEADALASRAGIMARKMLALGTTEALRHDWGDTWNVHLVHREAPHTSDEEMERVKGWVRRNVPGAVTESRTYHGQLRFHVPNSALTGSAAGELPPASSSSSATPSSRPSTAAGDDDDKIRQEQPATTTTTATTAGKQRQGKQHRKQGAGALFNLLERNRDELAFAYYSVAPTTLDQVFLNVVQRHNVEEEDYEGGGGREKREQRKKSMWGGAVKAMRLPLFKSQKDS